MGYTQAIGMAEATDLRTGIDWHLRHNHYPPVPTVMVDVAIQAIEQTNDGDPDRPIDLPDGVTYKDRTTVTAGQVVEAFHLEPWLT